MGIRSDCLRHSAARQYLLHSVRGAAQGLVSRHSDPGGLRAVRSLDLYHRQRAGQSAQRAGSDAEHLSGDSGFDGARLGQLARRLGGGHLVGSSGISADGDWWRVCLWVKWRVR